VGAATGCTFCPSTANCRTTRLPPPHASINRHVENIVRRFPEQYMWSYNRYKRPGSAPDPGGSA